MCLICGHVGCGRYRKGHAAEHSRSHNHAYSLELEAQRVWDYTNDNYVHRLVQSKKNGKLMELPSPAPSSSQAQRTCVPCHTISLCFFALIWGCQQIAALPRSIGSHTLRHCGGMNSPLLASQQSMHAGETWK